MSRDRRDGSKLSFSERDKQRRGGDERREPALGAAGAGRGDKAYRAALERAFANGEVQQLAETLRRASSKPVEVPGWNERGALLKDKTEANAEPTPPRAPAAPAVSAEVLEKRKLLKKVREAEDAKSAARALDGYLARFDELPKDFEILEKALGHLRQAIVVRALECLEECLAKSKPRRSRSLAMQLMILEEHHEDEEVRARAARVRASL